MFYVKKLTYESLAEENQPMYNSKIFLSAATRSGHGSKELLKPLLSPQVL